MRIDGFLDARQSRTGCVQGSRVNLFEGQLLRTATGGSQEQVRFEVKGILAEGHQPMVGPKQRTTAAQRGLNSQLGQTASSVVCERESREGRRSGRDRVDYQGSLVALEPSDKQPVNHVVLTASAGRQEQVTEEVQLFTSGPQLRGLLVYLSVRNKNSRRGIQ